MNGRRGELEAAAANGVSGASRTDNGIEHCQRVSGAIETDSVIWRVVDVETDYLPVARHTLG